MNHPPRLIRRIVVAAALIAIPSAAALAEEVTVKMPTANVLSGKRAASDRVALVKQGQVLQVVAHDGSWVKVKVYDKDGYIHENSVKSGSGGGGGLNIFGNSNASAASSAEASRGVGEALAWARAAGMNAAGLDRMIALRGQVTGGEWERFVADGQVGPAKK